MRDDIYSVKELLQQMKHTINQDEQLQNVALIGEVSNFSAHRSGHFYFNLKDDSARIACVMFKSRSSSVLFKPKEGDKVILVGRVDVFEASGSVQFYTDKMILDGLGQLHQQYEKLKMDFQAKGYFDQERKRPLKPYPKSIAIITGANSAAYADMHRTVRERWPSVRVYDLLSLVQGEGAKEQIVANLSQAQTLGVDVIILARGGGSIEDLWAFNEPSVVEAIASSGVPVITGVGHESDTTLSDLVADYRAATPTAAIVAALPSQVEINQRLRAYKNQYYVSVKNRLLRNKHQFDSILERSVFKDPMRMIDKKTHLLDFHKQQLVRTLARFDRLQITLKEFELKGESLLQGKFLKYKQNLNEHAQYTKTELLETLNQTKQNHTNTTSAIQYAFKTSEHEIVKLREQVGRHEQSMLRSTPHHVQLKQKEFVDIIKTLHTLSPLNIMARGYAITTLNDTIVKSVDELEIGSNITIRYSDGEANATITGKDSTHE